MRWQGQSLQAEDGAALPGMSRLAGLLRTVTVAEFPGVRFHEVAARSVLNEVPGGSRVPFRWTVNPYRGCTHACVYCLAGDTSVLMADGSTRALAELAVGDEIYGTKGRSLYRHYVRTQVLAHWRTVEPAHRVELAGGTQLVAGPDHRFLSARGWVFVAGAGSGATRRPHLRPGDALLGLGARVRAALGTPDDVRDQLPGLPVTGDPALEVVAIEPLGARLPMYDITTGTGDFIANGVVSHNCFARGTHAWLDLDTGRDFDAELVVKVNAPDVLRRELARPSWQRDRVALGTNTDPYQRAEGRYRLMPGIIGALAGSGTPFSILTKGTLMRRDLALIAAAAQDVGVGLGVSIAVLDQQLHERVEPGTPSPKARLELVGAVREAGLGCGVMLAPVLPWLTDGEQQLDEALARIAAAGASGVTVLPLHLRPGTRDWFMAWLAEDHPRLVRRYRELYRRGAYVPKEYGDWLAERVRPLLVRHRLAGPTGMRGLPDDGAAQFPVGSLPPATPAPAGPTQLTLL